MRNLSERLLELKNQLQQNEKELMRLELKSEMLMKELRSNHNCRNIHEAERKMELLKQKQREQDQELETILIEINRMLNPDEEQNDA